MDDLILNDYFITGGKVQICLKIHRDIQFHDNIK